MASDMGAAGCPDAGGAVTAYRKAVAIILASMVTTAPAHATEIPLALLDIPRIPVCIAGKGRTCVVDGDTVRVAGVTYRFEEIDTPEKGDLAECIQEGLQAIEAAKRLAAILSSHGFEIVVSGKDRFGRTLARFVIGDTTAGEMLVAEVLARPWRGRAEQWCD